MQSCCCVKVCPKSWKKPLQQLENVFARKCDIRKEKDVQSLFEYTMQKFGRCDILVNNAGGQFPSPAAAMTEKGWASVIDLNLNGTFRVCRHVYDSWMRDNGGAIVNIIADMFNGFPGMAHTGAARAGVENLTKTLALEWAPSHVRVCAVAPGIVETESAKAHYKKAGFEALLEKQAGSIPAQRLGTPQEISAAVCFLCSPGAAYITGATIRVDGASSLGMRDEIFGSPEYEPFPKL